MDSHPIITTIVVALVTAFIFGFIARKLNLPTIIGYLVAGVLIGPHTPGMMADVHIASQLAEIGIILLMFGVGLHFSIQALMDVSKIILPGIGVPIIISALGFLFGNLHGFQPIESLVFGFSLSVASTVVMLRTLEQRNEIDTQAGQIAIGWLIVEDVLTVFALVLLPLVANVSHSGAAFNWGSTALDIAIVFGKICVFAVGMFMFGRRFLPWLLTQLTKVGSRELTSLGTISIALGFAYVAYVVFDASFALGAFLAGLVLNESKEGQRAAKQTLPLRDAFSVLFFVSAGMLFDPTILVRAPVAVLTVLAIIIIGKIAAAFLITALCRQPRSVSLLVGISIAQIGEFSFVLGSVGRALDILSQELYDLILAGALLSIAINPFLFQVMDTYNKRTAKAAPS